MHFDLGTPARFPNLHVPSVEPARDMAFELELIG